MRLSTFRLFSFPSFACLLLNCVPPANIFVRKGYFWDKDNFQPMSPSLSAFTSASLSPEFFTKRPDLSPWGCHTRFSTRKDLKNFNPGSYWHPASFEVNSPIHWNVQLSIVQNWTSRSLFCTYLGDIYFLD